MTTKYHTLPLDSTGASALAQFPPEISLDSPLLGSVIDLPEHASITYKVYTLDSTTPGTSSDPFCIIEQARKKLIRDFKSSPVVNSLLPSVRVGRDYAELYVFAIASTQTSTDSMARLGSLALDGLMVSDSYTFTPAGLYPCSTHCASSKVPCPVCISREVLSSLSSSQATPNSKPSAAMLLPRRPLRRPYAQFIQAVRDRLIDEFASAPISADLSIPSKLPLRLGDGFVFSPTSSSSEWGTGWEYYSTERPLTYCQVQVHLVRTSHTSFRLLVHPTLHPTHYLPLAATLPLPSGTPIILLPYGTPAYYLNIYNGPSHSLTVQFDNALTGLGTEHWKSTFSSDSSSTQANANSQKLVIAWLSVQSKPGEDKGLPIIWPASLCLSYTPHAPSLHARSSLRRLPDLPSQLQASPPPPTSYIPLSLLQKDSLQTDAVPMSAVSAAPHPLSSIPVSPSMSRRTMSPLPRRAVTPRPAERPSFMSRSPTSDSLRAFRALTLSSTSRSLPAATLEVSGYVEAVAREREKERERMRKEKERDNKTPGNTPTKAPAILGTPTAPAPMSPTPITPVRGFPTATVLGQSLSQVQAVHALAPESPELLPSADIFGDSPGQEPDSPMETDPVPEVHEVPMPHAPRSQPPQPEPGPPPNFDPYNNFDTGWNLDYSMGFNMNMGSMANTASVAGPTATNFGLDEDFAFTDDDFNFFDNPSVTTKNEPSAANMDATLSIFSTLASDTGSLSADFTSTVMHDNTHLSYSAPPLSALSQPQTSHWLSNSLADGLTPSEVVATDLHVASSPAKTPVSHSAPSTPSVQLSEQYSSQLTNRRKSGPEAFEPILFAASHSTADHKYALGKFALPTPPDEEDRAERFQYRASSPLMGWKLRYHNATDPRVGIVRRLVGSKRKAPAQQGGRQSKLAVSWEREYEEWTSSSPTAVEDTKSESDLDDETWIDEDETTHSESRPITPPPPYVPLGPTLLSTYFQFSRLLPLSRPLESSPGNDTTLGTIPAPLSVPTPVSPAAVFGAASEKTKSLEAAAQILVKEAAENPVWAKAWNACAKAGHQTVKPAAEVWQAAVKRTIKLCGLVGSSLSSLQVQDLFTSSSDPSASPMHPLGTPMISVAKSNSVIQILPTALSFWEKLGLEPRAGGKDVTAYVFYESTGALNESNVYDWLSRVSSTYKARRLGTHAPGQSRGATNGAVSVQLESLRKTLSTFIEGLDSTEQRFVFYIVTPPTLLNLTSPVLRHVLSAIKRAHKSRLGPQIAFHFVPEDLILGGDAITYSGLTALVDAVYDKLLRPVDRVLSRAPAIDTENARSYFQDPMLVLARPFQPNVHFIREAHPSSLDVLDRHTILHVGYRVTPCGKWLLATCTDEWGEAHDLKAWLIPDDADESFTVTSVWNFTYAFAAKANIEWRVVISKLGPLSEKELDTWIDHLDGALLQHCAQPLQIFILSVEMDNSWMFLAPSIALDDLRPTSPNRIIRHPPGTILCDISSSTYSLSQIPPLPVYHRHFECSNLEKSLNTEGENESSQDSFMTLSLASTTLVHVPAKSDCTDISMLHLHLFHVAFSPISRSTGSHEDTLRTITKSFHDLTELLKARKGQERPHMPFHLATLEMMRLVLDRGDVVVLSD